MASRNQEIGKWGEGIAAGYLEEKGYKIIDQNVHTHLGEIDIIACLDDQGERYLIFVEVKTRTTLDYGYPEDGISNKKQETLYSTAQTYLQDHPELDYPWQVDVIAISRLPGENTLDIQHFENILR
jgi:putative endonuclease